MKIVTDTNIWYHIAEGKYSYQRVKGLPLCLTAINVMELLISPKRNNPDGKKAVKNACLIIKKLTPTYIEYLPLEYVANKIFGKKIKQHKVRLDYLDRIIMDDFTDEEMILITRAYIEMKDAYKTSVDSQTIKNRDDVKLKERMPNINNAVLMAINDTAVEVEKNCGVRIGKYTDNHKSKILNQLKFYNLARATNYQNTTLKGVQVAKNDQFDLYNMVYVGANDKYWTEDKKWLRKVHFQGIDEFLFSLPTTY